MLYWPTGLYIECYVARSTAPLYWPPQRLKTTPKQGTTWAFDPVYWTKEVAKAPKLKTALMPAPLKFNNRTSCSPPLAVLMLFDIDLNCELHSGEVVHIVRLGSCMHSCVFWSDCMFLHCKHMSSLYLIIMYIAVCLKSQIRCLCLYCILSVLYVIVVFYRNAN